MLSTIQLTRNTAIELNSVRYLQADINYTHFFLEGNQKIIASSSLKRFDLLLSKSQFRRISKSVMVNIDFIKSFNRKTITLIDGHEFKISRRRTKVLT
jgi:two-component system, LytTR family, response regulator